MKVGVASADPTDAVLSHDDHSVNVVHEISAGFGYFLPGSVRAPLHGGRWRLAPKMPGEASKLWTNPHACPEFHG